MDDVKPVHRYKAQTMFSFGGAKIEYFPHGPEVVLATEFDAQRLRADTAEAELKIVRESHESMRADLISTEGNLAAAEQRIAELTKVISDAEYRADQGKVWNGMEWTHTGLSSHAQQKVLDILRAAINPKPEAGSHGS